LHADNRNNAEDLTSYRLKRLSALDVAGRGNTRANNVIGIINYRIFKEILVRVLPA